MRFVELGRPTLRGGRTYSPSEFALLQAHLNQAGHLEQLVVTYEQEALRQDIRLRSALARVASAALTAGVDHAELHRLVEVSSAVTTDAFTASRDHAPTYPL